MGVAGAPAGERIEVEPDALIGAGKQMGSLGTQLGMLSDALGSVVSAGLASGTDPAGLDFGLKYGDQAQEFATALADAANAFKSVGFMLEATGHNYANADAASTVGGPGPTGGVGSEPSETKAGDAATGPNSNTVSPPTKWHLIVPFLNVLPGGMFAGAALTWPSGNSGMMRLTATQWRNLGQGLSIFDDAVSPVRSLVSEQQIPEGGKIGQVLDKLGQAVSNLSDTASGLAQSIDDFAGGVQETQDAIRRLLDRISLGGAWDMVKGVFTGEADDILREVARDVGKVLENFQNQVKGLVGLLEELASAIGDAVTSLQDWVRPHLEELLGDEVGGALADAFTVYTDFQVGLTTGLINTVAGTVAMADPDTWKGMAETVMTVAKDPSKLPGVLADMGAEFIALDKWSGDHPGRAAGEAAFNIGSLFVPGGALSKTGTLAKGLSATRGLLDSGRIPGLRGLGSGPGTRGVDGVPELDNVGAGLPDAPEVRPPGVPESLISPTSPNGFDAPSSPRGLDGPPGPPNPPGPTGTAGGGESSGIRGGGGPPPDPPGRAAGPSDDGPGGVDGPPPRSPESPGPGNVDSPTGGEPSAPNHAPTQNDPQPPVAQRPPESAGPPPSPDHTPAGTSHPDAGTAPSPGGHAGDSAPGHGSPNTVESNGQADARPSADSPAIQAPAADTHDGSDRTTADTNPVAQQPHTFVDSSPGRHDPGSGTPPVGMAGVAPMAPHAPAAAHSPETSARSPESRVPDTRAPEGRTPEARSPEARAPETPRAQQPAATGPTPGQMPTAPVNPAGHAATAPGETTHAKPEPQASRPDGDKRDNSPSASHPATHHTARPPTGDRPANQSDAPGSNQGAGSAQDPSPHHSGQMGNPANARTYGPHELRPVEDHSYQTAVEDALRNSDGDYIRHADPRTNSYGNLINDGGHTVQGRSNNCLDCSLSALSSFRGDPTVSAPRYPDLLPNGAIDSRSGERGGLQRASDWLGDPVRPVSPGLPIAHRFAELHQRLSDMGPGSSALVVNEWHARDFQTGQPLYHPDGRPVIEGSHATVVVYPENAAGPVWWDPQMRTTSDYPPTSMIERSASLWATTVSPSEGVRGNATGDTGTGTGVSGADTTGGDLQRATVRERVDLQGGPPSRGEPGAWTGDGESDHRQADRSRDGSTESPDGSDSQGVRGGETNGWTLARPADLSVSMEDHDPAGAGGRDADRVPADGGVVDQPTGADTTTSVDHPQAHIHERSDGLAVERGDVARGMGQPAEPGSVAGSGHDRGVGSDGSDRSDGNHDGDRDAGLRTQVGPESVPAASEHGTPDEGLGSPWDGPTGRHAAEMLPTDDSGYRIQPRDCEFLGISPDQVEAWAEREAPLGMARGEFNEFSNSLFDALGRDGIGAEDLDVRLQGSSARFFSGEHKSLPLESDLVEYPDAISRMTTWFGDDEDRPLRRPFDSMHRLGLDEEPSDYDIQISSDQMVDACRHRWEADGSQGDLVHPKYGFISKRVFGQMFPNLWEWAEEWTERTGRPVVPALFAGDGPPDTSASGVSSHFRESDWHIRRIGNEE
ncbi:toxin glutamine deamidase domain-containing protein [Mycolicibacterium monacense]|uniref:toxin glutamine deamidase domain-containing protein n=1 Tax=Mycolicibacterium monacense TaxID=85693 RepID=UPI0007E9FAD7|nr:toxin glutamine deamidase domain-containing protein [Mycolicibacterium monacense]OBF46957.1 hypothetical protein A5778_25830 [Mycolicibacterium monacense]